MEKFEFSNLVYKIWEIAEKIKMDVTRLLLIWTMKKTNTFLYNENVKILRKILLKLKIFLFVKPKVVYVHFIPSTILKF